MKGLVTLPSYVFKRFSFSTVDMVNLGDKVCLIFRDDLGNALQTLLISQ